MERLGISRIIGPVLAIVLAASQSAARAQEPDWRGLITKAYEYGFPAFEQARLIYNFSYSPADPHPIAVNQFRSRKTPAGATRRVATTPNDDTLYSSAVIDVSAGPVRLDVPAFGERYFTIALLDSYTNNFAHVSTETGATSGGSYWIVGPRWHGEAPSDVTVIRAPSRHIIALVRIYVAGPKDYPAVYRLQAQMKLTPTVPSPMRKDLIAPMSGDGTNFVAVVDQVLHDDPPPAADGPILMALAPAGIGIDAPPLTPRQKAAWRRYFPDARAALVKESRQMGPRIRGWDYPPADIGDFGTDYRTRAVIALRGIWANIPAELSYAVAAADETGAPLLGARKYRLHLPAGAPPVREFWSISIYQRLPDGRLFFGKNEIHRYSINSRDPNLVLNKDGSLDIWIERAPPPKGMQANWLPIPGKRFELVMRAYLPRPALLDGRFRYPAIERR